MAVGGGGSWGHRPFLPVWENRGKSAIMALFWTNQAEFTGEEFFIGDTLLFPGKFLILPKYGTK